jgi:hypothetical protein
MNTDNQQQTVSDFEIGWMAGIIEGEGSIVLQIHKRKGRSQQLRVTPRIIVTNSDVNLIDKYIDILKRLNVGRYVRHTKPNNRRASDLFKAQGKNPKFKDMTWVYVEGFKRMHRILPLIVPCMYGEKKVRASLLLKFIVRRIENSKSFGKAINRSYDQGDVDLMIEFLELTNSPNKNKLAGMLNEHTQEAKKENLRKLKREWNHKNKDKINARRRFLRSRCALDLQETARGN